MVLKNCCDWYHWRMKICLNVMKVKAKLFSDYATVTNKSGNKFCLTAQWFTFQGFREAGVEVFKCFKKISWKVGGFYLRRDSSTGEEAG
ncbi:hypothetical protein TNCT_521851 [Trichonephila clavata]|uniref:Uncharacterized protein n=1 Tax=Trichonephila clavata TaxID=2740835 RepID=A0A8X6GI83_TRICU|nr:hypothetical protein TNCT_521851 [Trichonephila clavata]